MVFFFVYIDYNATPLYYVFMIRELLNQRNLSVYKCAQLSGIPYTTLLEIVTGKTDIEKCSAETVYRLARTLDLSMEDLLEKNDWNDFENFKSNLKHRLKEVGDTQFLVEAYLNDDVRKLWNASKKAKALYFLATIDYLSRINHLPLAKDYNDIREFTLAKPLLPKDLLIMKKLDKSSVDIETELEQSIPEFNRFNIVEGDLRDVA